MLNDFMVPIESFYVRPLSEEDEEYARRYMARFNAQDLYEMLGL